MPITQEILLDAGDILYKAGDPNDCGYVIASGEVILYNQLEGSRHECERRGAGSILGELSILTGQPRTVTVEATRPCLIYTISAEQILARFEELDPVLKACIETSLNFATRLYGDRDAPEADVPMAPTTLQDADALLYQIKFEQDVLKGLKNKEFSMVYQPIVSLANGRIVGAEALMRWEHPVRGFVSPDLFIPIAENMGSIGKLTDYAIEDACHALSRIRTQIADEADLYVSVNVSGEDIGRAEFVDHLAHVLDKHDLTPDHIKLEVTETALVPQGDAAKEALRRIKKFGCGVSIDDFGTGYSNLAYLKSLPLTALKIDRAFAGDAYHDPVSRGIVRMLVGLGRELGVDIIAEGLETSDDVATLRGLGCRFAQGYFFHRPMPEDELIYLIAEQRNQTHSAVG